MPLILNLHHKELDNNVGSNVAEMYIFYKQTAYSIKVCAFYS